MLYCDVIFRQLILDIDCYTLIIGLDFKKWTFFSSLPKDHDCEGFTETFWWDLFRRENTIATDLFFILENIRIYCQMDGGKFEGLSYTILSEEPFKNQIFHMTGKTNDYTISE